MPRVLSDAAVRVMDNLPPYYADDPTMQATIQATANEFGRIEDAGRTLQTKAFPTRADDEYNLLAIWETLLGLPVQPPSLSVAQRRTRVLARLRGRGDGRGKTWEQRMTDAIGSTQWSYAENTPGAGQLTITIPYAPGGESADWVGLIARELTPAHIQIVMAYGQGFILGVSELGDAL